MRNLNLASLLFFVLTGLATITSCKDTGVMPEPPTMQTGDPCPPISNSERWSCYVTTMWNNVKITETMIGSWEWKYAKCFIGTEASGCQDTEKYTVEFRPDGMLVVVYNGENVQTASWQVVAGEHDNEFTVETEPAIYRLSGYIVICNDVIGFEELYIDGCNNYFKRKQ